jgi:hypothetical protein
MALFLLGILFALIGAVLALPHIRVVRRLAGLDEEERCSVSGPVVTGNYRPWMLRPVARTGDGFPSPARRRLDLIEPVTVLGAERRVVNAKNLPYPPRGIRVYGGPDTFGVASRSVGKVESCRVNPDLLPERRAGFELGLVLGDRQLLNSLGERDFTEQQAGTAAKD